MTLSATTGAAVSVKTTGAAVFGVSPEWAASSSKTFTYTNGTGSGQANIEYVAERTVSDGGTDAVDLTSLTDSSGNAISFVNVKYLGVFNVQKDGTANTTSLTIGGGSNPYAGTLNALPAISPGGDFEINSPAAGLGAVVAATGDIINIVNGAGAANTYQIFIIGVDA